MSYACLLYTSRQPQEPGQEETVSQRPSAPEPAESEPDNAPASLEEEAVPALSNTKMGWGPGKEVNDRNQTTGSIDFQNKYGDLGAYFIMPEDDGMIYLTFDLGYENGYTESILDTLAQHNVKAVSYTHLDVYKRQSSSCSSFSFRSPGQSSAPQSAPPRRSCRSPLRRRPSWRG